jgi:hypothetical protein
MNGTVNTLVPKIAVWNYIDRTAPKPLLRVPSIVAWQALEVSRGFLAVNWVAVSHIQNSVH